MDLVPIWLWHNAGAHDDLQLELGDLRHGCCSCSLLLLDDTLTHQTDSFGALARFLQLWLDELDTMRQRAGETFLPYDFYDEGSSWPRVFSGDTIEATVVAGSRSFEGIFTFLPVVPAGGGSVWLRVCVGDANETTHAF